MKYCDYCRACKSRNLLKQDAVLAPFITFRIHGMMPSTVTDLYNLENGTNYLPCLTLGCKDCGFIGSNLLFDDEEMGRYYKSYMTGEYLEQRYNFEGSVVHKNSRPNIVDVEEWILTHIRSPTAVIDYGAIKTDFTPFNTCGKIVLTDIQNKIKTNEHFDLLSCLHVIEHVCDIDETIMDICTYNFTHAYFEVPNEKYLQVPGKTFEDKVKDKQFWHEHLNFFSVESFTKVLSNYFNIIDVKSNKDIIGVLVLNNCSKVV